MGGTPYTPYDRARTATRAIWDVTGQGIQDFNRLNTLRNPDAYQIDLRIDKKYFFDTWSLNVYLDVENVTNAVVQLRPNIDVVREGNGNPIEDPDDPSKYQIEEIQNTAGLLLPSVGVVIEF
ncbi:MAG: hypothetical protein LC664_08730 [Flavobacteriales bacterium]|nr:hypothetical protein [Flavobacteriales bacterium]